MHSTKTTVIARLLVAGLVLAAFGCGATRNGGGTGDPVPRLSHPQPETAGLRAGLAVKYHRYRFRSVKKSNEKTELRHIDDMPDVAAMEMKGYDGPPVTRLTHRAGRGGEVFDSGADRLICVQLRGLIRFDRAGEYRLRAESNDGVRIFVDDRLVIDDPSWHSDRMSRPATVDIREPGWYPLLVRYYQRKGTSALLLHWQPPGDEGFALVPAEAYAHLKNPS